MLTDLGHFWIGDFGTIFLWIHESSNRDDESLKTFANYVFPFLPEWVLSSPVPIAPTSVSTSTAPVGSLSLILAIIALFLKELWGKEISVSKRLDHFRLFTDCPLYPPITHTWASNPRCGQIWLVPRAWAWLTRPGWDLGSLVSLCLVLVMMSAGAQLPQLFVVVWELSSSARAGEERKEDLDTAQSLAGAQSGHSDTGLVRPGQSGSRRPEAVTWAWTWSSPNFANSDNKLLPIDWSSYSVIWELHNIFKTVTLIN